MSDLPPPAPSSGQTPATPTLTAGQPAPRQIGPWVLLLIGVLVALVAVLATLLVVRETDDEDEPTTTSPGTSVVRAPTPAPGGGGDGGGDSGDGGDGDSVAPAPGDPCTVGSDPDCIDPDGDGQGTYLVGGGDCVATSPDPSLCEDLDGDGVAGFPDTG